MAVIVDNVTAKNEEGSSEVIVKAVKGIERNIKDLLMWAVDDCLNQLSTALKKFKVWPTSGYTTFMVWAVDFYPFSSLLSTSDLIQKLHAHLAKIQSLTQQVANKVDDVHDDVKDIKQISVKTRRSATLRPSVFQ